ncbi:MAG: XRE family transcriptional regulator [Porcipelethomonas sp.]
MKQKDTEKLLELLKKSGSIDLYLQENKDFLLDCSIKEYLNTLLKEKQLTIAKLSQGDHADISDRYLYQIFSASNPRVPSREVLLCICIGMGLNLDETQTALKIAKYAALYPKDERDSIIIFGIENSHSLIDINNSLYEHDLKCLGEK